MLRKIIEIFHPGREKQGPEQARPDSEKEWGEATITKKQEEVARLVKNDHYHYGDTVTLSSDRILFGETVGPEELSSYGSYVEAIRADLNLQELLTEGTDPQDPKAQRGSRDLRQTKDIPFQTFSRRTYFSTRLPNVYWVKEERWDNGSGRDIVTIDNLLVRDNPKKPNFPQLYH